MDEMSDSKIRYLKTKDRGLVLQELVEVVHNEKDPDDSWVVNSSVEAMWVDVPIIVEVK